MWVGNSGGALRLPFPRRLRPPQGGDAGREFAFLRHRFTPRSVFMDIGSAPNGEMSALALRAANYVELVYAVDVSGRFLQSVLVPLNMRLVLSDGVHIAVPEASVDVAFSGRFLEQLPAAHRLEHLKSVRRALAPGGVYFSASPAPFLEAGFTSVRCYASGVRIPMAFANLFPQAMLRYAAL